MVAANGNCKVWGASVRRSAKMRGKRGSSNLCYVFGDADATAFECLSDRFKLKNLVMPKCCVLCALGHLLSDLGRNRQQLLLLFFVFFVASTRGSS